jgi:hypothetical protein
MVHAEKKTPSNFLELQHRRLGSWIAIWEGECRMVEESPMTLFLMR